MHFTKSLRISLRIPLSCTRRLSLRLLPPFPQVPATVDDPTDPTPYGSLAAGDRVVGVMAVGDVAAGDRAAGTVVAGHVAADDWAAGTVVAGRVAAGDQAAVLW